MYTAINSVIKSFLISCFLIISCAHAEIPRLGYPHPCIFRGGLPTETSDYRMLKAMGIKVVLSLITSPLDIRKEEKIVQRLGMEFVSIPLSGFLEPSQKDISQIMDLFLDAVDKPIFVHCRHGEDRTGLVIGIFRVRQEGWTLDEAYEEMLNWGFKPVLIGLSHFFWSHAKESQESQN